MEKITVRIGSVVGMSSGQTQDNTRQVEFVGEELASRREYGFSNQGNLTDTRGVDETLYKTEDEQLVVHVEEWSHWQGEPNHYYLVEVTEDDLGVNGRFEALGAEAGFGRPLTLDESLTPPEEEL